ncbi:MAG: hypothetical protein ACI9HJ_001944, partial [Ulvibacter sp.]
SGCFIVSLVLLVAYKYNLKFIKSNRLFKSFLNFGTIFE